MEERLPTSDYTKNKLPPPPGAVSLETYVVQIPRDQIYRVPPPERALIIEEHQRSSSNQEANRRSYYRSYAIPVVLIAIIAVIAAVTVRATLYGPKTPEFTITHIQGKNLEADHRPLEFKITIQAKNGNTRMSVSYEEGGEVTLVFKDKKIGQGKIPKAVKAGASGDDVDFTVVLVQNGAPLSNEIKKSLNDDKEKLMELNFELPMEMKSWMRNERKNHVKISCDFGVRNSLMNMTNISHQECVTEY